MANLAQLTRLRGAAKQHKVRLTCLGEGNAHKITARFPDGRLVRVWYPWEGRVNNLEEIDLEELINEINKGGI